MHFFLLLHTFIQSLSITPPLQGPSAYQEVTAQRMHVLDLRTLRGEDSKMHFFARAAVQYILFELEGGYNTFIHYNRSVPFVWRIAAW